MSGPTYSIDTSALLDGLERYYPPDVFPALWGRVDGLIDEGRLFASEEVWEELQKRDEAGAAWMAPRRYRILVPTDAAVTSLVKELLRHPDHKLLVMNGKGRSRADPFVIAVAELRGAIVVTGEVMGSERRPRIPNVCEGRGIEWIPFLEIIKREGWTF